MTQNPRAIVRTIRLRLGIVAAWVIMAATMLTPVSAAAAPVAGSAVPAPPDSSTADIAVTDTTTQCTSFYRWQADQDFDFGGWSQVEWTSNRCGYSIQERSWCNLGGGSGFWSTSGVVVSVDLWDKSGCSLASGAVITRGEVRFNYGGGWTTYATFWAHGL